MAKPLMLYGSKRHSGLMVKDGGPIKLAERLSAHLAINASISAGGHLTKGGVSKLSGLEKPVSRLIRFNERKG